MTTREKALERALLRLCEECPIDHTWPPYKAAVSNALHLLTKRITPAEYLAATDLDLEVLAEAAPRPPRQEEKEP